MAPFMTLITQLRSRNVNNRYMYHLRLVRVRLAGIRFWVTEGQQLWERTMPTSLRSTADKTTSAVSPMIRSDKPYTIPISK